MSLPRHPLGVFISYRRDGGAEAARVVESFLEANECDVFLDVDGLGAGAFDEQILRQIESREVFVLICSRGCFERCREPGDWVRRELEHALRRRRRVVPVVLRGFDWPSEQELPESIRPVARFNAFEYSHAHWKETRVKLMRLVQENGGEIGGSASDLNAGRAAVPDTTSPSDSMNSLDRLLDRVAREGEIPSETDLVLLRNAAEEGDAEAQFVLGACYDRGRGTERLASAAARWYRLAASKGHPDAQFRIGLCCRDGTGVVRNDAEAVDWFRRATELGHAEAPCYLGAHFREGVGVERNDAAAAHWYRVAADRGSAPAWNNLGVLHLHGLGVEKDVSEAARCFRIAADRGHAEAQFNLGVCYRSGWGVAADEVEARRWLQLAAESGIDASNHGAGESPEQRSMPQRRLILLGIPIAIIALWILLRIGLAVF
jgi:TPR repeat protein